MAELDVSKTSGLRLATLAGAPAVGKTAVLAKALRPMVERGLKVGVVKLDCSMVDERETYARLGVEVAVGLAGALCPDHYFACNIDRFIEWGQRKSLDLLVTESAGLCGRCAPHIKGVLGICVVDVLSGLHAPRKIGPMLKLADYVLITKGDIVSQAEREVFSYRVQQVAPRAGVSFVNGLTGQGSDEVGRLLLEQATVVSDVNGLRLRFPMPAALCSYCLGETRLGAEYRIGNVSLAKLP